ncbi:MAG: N-acetylneuraminate synthase family protein [Bacillota bacterium]
MNKVMVIAEVANAHQGKVNILESLIRAAAVSGADGIKFQWFKYDYLATPDYHFYLTYKDLFIPEEKWPTILSLAKNLGLDVWVDIFDDWGLQLAYKLTNLLDGFKIPSTVIQSDNIIDSILSIKKPILVGVGGWYDKEIDSLLALFRERSAKEIILLHGFQGYPTSIKYANLARISYLKTLFNLQVGFADHVDAAKSIAIYLPIYAFFAGATIIEKHITLNRSQKGYDYYSSLEPDEFTLMVSKLREAEVAMGGLEVRDSERDYLKDAVRVVAAKDIEKGEIIALDKTANKRCADKTALMPEEFKKLLPVISLEKISENRPILSRFLRKPKITIVVICRLKSVRLPKKALLPIYGVPSIERCLLNCLAAPDIDHVVLATSDLAQDDPLEQLTINGKVKVIRGDADNVAKRMFQAAKETDADIALRVTGDCPAVAPEILKYLINSHLESGKDFTVSTGDYSLGTVADVYTVESLERLLNQPKSLTHTEYLSFYFINNPNIFSVNRVELPVEFRYPEWHLTLDEQKDLEMLETLYSNLNIGREPLYFSQLRRYLTENPEVGKINSGVSVKWKDDMALVEMINKATVLDRRIQ